MFWLSLAMNGGKLNILQLQTSDFRLGRPANQRSDNFWDSAEIFDSRFGKQLEEKSADSSYLKSIHSLNVVLLCLIARNFTEYEKQEMKLTNIFIGFSQKNKPDFWIRLIFHHVFTSDGFFKLTG
jgi:hypothetical protein